MFWQQIHQLDQHISLAINGCHSSFTDHIWMFFSDKLVWIPMYAGIIALLFWKLGWKKALISIAAVLLTFGFCDQFYFSRKFTQSHGISPLRFRQIHRITSVKSL
jgi:AraC-like DNA-binding protein